MELSKRMLMNAGMIDDGVMVADIGCDHGYVSIYLATKKKCPKVIAMDVGTGPLSQAKKNVSRENLSEIIHCRLSDGLEKLSPYEVDAILIAGMGGMLVTKILSEHPEVTCSLQTLVLQPQWDYRVVRQKVFELGFHIAAEDFCMDNNKPYLVMRCEKGEETDEYTSAELSYGRIRTHRNKKEYIEYLNSQIVKTKGIIARLKEETSENSQKRIGELQQELDLLNDVIS